MTKSTIQMNITRSILNDDNTMVDSVKVLSEFTKKDIEKSYNLDTVKGTEAYFSSRYGWSLRKTAD
tara:strand:+ start:285 stop:482 length:198 start_codon:yes stop_codon:yes gene_type:complete